MINKENVTTSDATTDIAKSVEVTLDLHNTTIRSFLWISERKHLKLLEVCY
jgi:hypothetical protein